MALSGLGCSGDHIENRLGQRHLAERQAQPSRCERGGKEIHSRRTDEAGDEQIRRPLVEFFRSADLLSQSAAHDHHPVTQRHRLGLVVGDVHRRRTQPALQPRDLGAHLHPQLGVQVRQRLVHEKSFGLAHNCATHRDALALAAGKLRRFTVQKIGQVKDFRGLFDFRRDLRLLHLRQRQREGDVLPHAHMRVQRIGLENHCDVAVFGRFVVDPFTADQQISRRDALQPGDHVQCGGFTAT